MHLPPGHRTTAFSLVEALLAIALLGSVAALAVSSMSHVVKSSRDQKLSSDVAAINRSVVSFLASGGDLSNVKTPGEVLSALKQSLANGEKIPGLSGSKLDAAVSVELQSQSEVRSDEPRAYWDFSKQRFFVANKGENPGIKRFIRDSSLEQEDYGKSKSNFAFSYASEDKWIWDFKETAVSTTPGTTPVTVSVVPNTSLPAPNLRPAPPCTGSCDGS